MDKIDRRAFLKTGIVGGVMGILASPAYARKPTPPEIEGPFYPVFGQKDKDFDLTKIQGKQGVAKGKIIIVQGRVLDTEDNPIEDATIDMWQANAAGRYRHPHDRNPAPLDSNFQGWGIVPSGKDGAFRFITVLPGAYPASDVWTRPPHLHFKVSKLGYREITTQMYFPDQRLNDADLLLQMKSDDEQKVMIAIKAQDDPETYDYTIVLQKVT